MPLISLELPPEAAIGLKGQTEFWLYRISAYLLINVIDDPAWLAMVFC